MEQILAAWRPRMLSILRIMAALLFMEHGLMKLFAFPLPQPGVPNPLPTILLVAAVLALGLFTRLAAFICAGQMAVAYFTAHMPQGFWPGGNGGDAAILFCFIFLYLVFAGPGSWSIDTARGRRS